MARPSGVVTFLFTDIEGSTRRWEADREGMEKALEVHDALLGEVVEAHGGALFKHTGDGVCACFGSPSDAIAAAVGAMRLLELPVRMGLHSGEVQERDGDFFGPTLNRAARVMGAGHGGQILVSSVSAAMADGVDLLDLGTHQLRDLAEPEHLWQVVAPGLQQQFPRLRVLDSSATNLPRQRSAFVGRERELRVILSAMDRSRVVTLTGVGGVGKTRLAIQAAAEALPRFADGVWLCELAPVSSLDGVVEVVSSAMRIDQQQALSLEDSLIEALKRRTALVVLDNCEHILDDVAYLVERILDACRDVTLVATSREGLAIDGEQLVAVPALGVPGSDGAVTGEAVDLFVDRARSFVEGFELDTDNREAVADLCRRLDGIPLAIELAASRVVSMTPREIVDRLDERFRLLAGGRRRALERHQTLRRTVDWSYDLLDPISQVVMQRLAVFGGSFELAAAEAVATGPTVDRADVLDVLSELVAKSMLVAETVHSRSRYRFLETLRQYGEDRLEESGDLDRVTDLATDHLIHWQQGAVEGLLGPDEADWFDRVQLELPNLRRAVDVAIDRGDSDRGFGLVAPFHQCVNGPASLVGRLATLATTAFSDARHHLAPAVLTLAAEDHLARGAPNEAIALTATADQVSDDLSLPRLASTAQMRATAFLFRGQLEDAHRHMADGWQISKMNNERYLEICCQSGFIYTGIAGGLLEAPAALDQARDLVALADQVGSVTGRAIAHWTLATVFSDLSPRDALVEFLISTELAPSGSRVDDASANYAAITGAQLGDTDTALAILDSKFFEWRRDGNIAFLEGGVIGLAVVAERLGDPHISAALLGSTIDTPRAALFPELIEDTVRRLQATLGIEPADGAIQQGREADAVSMLDLAAEFLAEEADKASGRTQHTA